MTSLTFKQSVFCVALLYVFNNLFLNQATFGQEVRKTEKAPLLKGEVTYLVPKGTPIKLKVAALPMWDMRLMNRDIDNNPRPAVAGQLISARVVDDIYVDENKVIPEGSVFYGKIDKVIDAKRMFKSGSVEISFTRLKLPNGKLYAFKATADNAPRPSIKRKLKNLKTVASYAAGGAIVGTIAAFALTGISPTIAMHGYNIAGGAAGGALLAGGYALLKKGTVARLEPGDTLNLNIDTNLLLPIAQAPKPKVLSKIKGLYLNASKVKVIDDGVNGKLLKLELTIVNKSDKTIKSIDMFIEDSNGNRCPLMQPLEDTSDYQFSIEPYTMEKLTLTFECEYPKLNQTLVILDHNTRTVCHEEKITYNYE